MNKVTIDLSNDSIVDLTIDELKKLQTMVKVSIQVYNRNSKKKKPIQGTLFGSIETSSEIKTTFEKSNVSNWIIFEKEFLQFEQMGVDISYYFNAVKDWSLTKTNEKRTAKGWIATARNFMRSDAEKEKLKMIDNLPKETISTQSMLDYLNM
jgi:hypothetical protein